MAASKDLLGEYADGFAVFGAVAASYIALKLLLSIWNGLKAYFVGKTLGLNANLKKMGQWAVVTGSTDGIGKAYAHELANMGLDIVLISRNAEKLSDVAAEIESKSKVKTKCVAIDFTGGPEIYAKIKKEIENLDVGVLVNNVGMSYSHPEYYSNVDEQVIRNVLNVNVNSVAEMTKIVLKGMLEKKRGAIINISSGSGLVPTPMLTLYSGTKSFVDFFSQALQTEYRDKGIIVQCVMPFFVSTKLSKIRKSSFMVPNPTTYVRSALATVGIERRTFGCVSHALQAWLVARVTSSIYWALSLKIFLVVRKKYIAREKKESHND